MFAAQQIWQGRILFRGAAAARLMFSRSYGSLATSATAAGGGSGSGGHRPGAGAGRSGGSGAGGFGRKLGLWSLVAMGSMVLAGTAHAAKPEKEMTIESVTNALWAASGPMLTNLGFSGCIGVACGVALKKIGQFVAFLIGLSFMALQGLAYAGFVTVNWTNVHNTVNSYLDLNRDGKIDEKDFKMVVGQGLGILAQGVPSIGGFLAGFMLGVRM